MHHETSATSALSSHRVSASLVMIFVFGAAYLVISKLVLRNFPFSGDEYSYFLQGEIFARGALHTPAPPHADLFIVDHVVVDTMVRSKYPPGTSALLALGVVLHAPWLVTPFEGVMTLLLLRRCARALYGEAAALATVIVAGLSPMYVFHASSYFSHAAASMWIAAALAAVVEWMIGDKKRWLMAAGMAVGCAFLTRPVEAAVLAASMLALRKIKPIALIAAGAIPVSALMLAYNAAQFGSPLADGYRAYEPIFRQVYGEGSSWKAMSLVHVVDGEELTHHLNAIRGFLVEWSVPGAFVIALLGARGDRHEPMVAKTMRHLLLAFSAITLAAYFPMIAQPDDGVPPRYLSTLLLPMALFAGPGWVALAERLASFGARWTRALAGTAMALGALGFGAFLDVRVPAIAQREGLYREVAALGIHDAIVMVHARFPTRYLRNGPAFDGPVLYVLPDRATPAELASWFPGREVYEAHEREEERAWTLRKL